MNKAKLYHHVISIICVQIVSLMLCLASYWDESIILIRIGMFFAFFGNVILGLRYKKQNATFLVFLTSFFILLMGRTTFYSFAVNQSYNFNYGLGNVSEHDSYFVFLLITVSIVFLSSGYYISRNKREEGDLLQERKGQEYVLFSKACILIFYFTISFNVLIILEKIQYVAINSYLTTYVNYSSRFPSFIQKLAEMCPLAYYGYLASLPPKQKAIKHIVVFMLMSALTLFSGSRGDFVLNLLMMSLYFIYRHHSDDPWVTRREITMALIGTPLLMILIVIIKALRYGQEINSNNILSFFFDFFNQQGVSINVISATVSHYDELQKNVLYSLSEITDFLKGNALSQMIHPFTVYRSNTIDNALYSNHLANVLSYKELGSMYLRGRGIGTSYIAELYADFNIFGVAVGSCFIGTMLNYLPKKLRRCQSPFLNMILLLMIKEIIFSPRDKFSSFLMAGINITSLITLATIYLLTRIMKRGK